MRVLSSGSWRDIVYWSAYLGFALAGAWALNLIWWGLLSPSANPRNDVTIVIQEGTSSALAGGAQFLFVPASLDIGKGGALHIVNKDTVEHVIGAFHIQPGERATITAPASSGDLVCTIHPSGYLGLEITKRPPIWKTLLPSFLLGAPLGLLAGVAARVAGKLAIEPQGQPVA